MSALDFADLSRHLGHALQCVAYVGTDGEPVNVSVECEDCCEVLLDFDKTPCVLPVSPLEDGHSEGTPSE